MNTILKTNNPSTFDVQINGNRYKIKKNNRIKNDDLWTVLRNGKPFATIRWSEQDGWSGTFSTTFGSGSALWMHSKGTTLDERIQKLHDANEDFMQRIIKN